MGVSVGANAHEYAQKEDEERVTISDHRTQEATWEGRMARRHHQIEVLEAAEGMEGLLYGPGIDGSVSVKKKHFWTRFSQNHFLKDVVHDISKTASSIGLKFLHNLFE